jgi:hypothetical protein
LLEIPTAVILNTWSRIFKELIAARPFGPFTIHLMDGAGLHVPMIDHVHIAPTPQRVFVWHDNGRYDTIRPVMISRVTADGEAAPSNS